MEQDINITIGKNIRIRRSLMGFSQSALAGRLGITFQQVQKYEKGTNSVSPAKLLQCSKIFGCGVEELFHDTALLLGENMPMPVPSRRSLHLVQSFERLGSAELQKRIGDLVHALAKPGPEDS